MSTRSRFLARLIGLFLIVIALSMALNKTTIAAEMAAIVGSPALLFTFGMMALAGGLAMVLAHNVWSDGAGPLLVTLLGWATLAKSVMLLFLAPAAIEALYAYLRFGNYFYPYAAVIMAIGLYLAWVGFSAAARSPKGQG